ncbi:acyl transferase/acyl hydrolase/lysophospholipase [Trichophaea hybrida]|nr:acyl transferase/acyl hydrolase/lysophospholipase [Trichophaea hybrida]
MSNPEIVEIAVDQQDAPNEEIEPLALKQHVLTLDGGGIRGYSSLIILQELMEKIARLERIDVAIDVNGNAADHPLPLPCHYFDYIFGSSTGGLSAIMLGRLRMSVRDSLIVYDRLGSEIFSNPRRAYISRSPFNGGWWRRSKYRAENLEQFLKTTTEDILRTRYQDMYSPTHSFFPSDENQCKTAVVAVEKSPNGLQPFLFRSYNSSDRLVLNPGYGHNVLTWKVARATTAAPGIFPVMKLDEMTFLDGGIGFNNPSKLAYDEVTACHHDITSTPIQLLFNIGTGICRIKPRQAAGHSRLRPLVAIYSRLLRSHVYDVDQWTDSRGIEHDIKSLARAEGQMLYYCLNVQDGLPNIPMDEWKKDGSTLATIEAYTRSYMALQKTQIMLNTVARLLVDARVVRESLWTLDRTSAFYHNPSHKVDG